MGVIKHPTKDGWYILDLRNGKKGPRQRIPFQGTWDAAFDEYNRLRGMKAAYHDRSTPICDLVPEFIREYQLEKSPTTVTNFKYAWKRLAPTFGHLSFLALTPDHIIQYKERRLADTWSPAHHAKDAEATKRHSKPITKRTVTKELSYLSTLCKWAAKKGYCPPLNFQIRGFQKKHVRPRAPIVLHQGEIEKITTAARAARKVGLVVLAGHGLNYRNIDAIATLADIEELNIGHSIVARAALVGLDKAVREMIALMQTPRRLPSK